MLTHKDARSMVAAELRIQGLPSSGPEELVILDDETIERPWGWVFFYTSRGWRDDDSRYAVGGNAPIIVNRFDGTLQSTGTACPPEYYISAYEADLERQQGAWELVIQVLPSAALDAVSRIRKALGLSVAEVGALKKRLPCVWMVGARTDLEPILAKLITAGVPAEIRRATRLRADSDATPDSAGRPSVSG
jgi:hypothetical protein